MKLSVAPNIKTLAILHLAERSGASMSVAPTIGWLAEGGEVEVLVPGDGQARRDYERFGSVSNMAYQALTLPRGPLDTAKFARRMLIETWAFRREIRRRRPNLVVIETSTLPAALAAARLEHVPTVTWVAELYTGKSVTGRSRGIHSKALLRVTEALSSVIVCCSNTVASQFRGESPKVVTAYSPINTDPGRPDGSAFRRQHGLCGVGPIIGVAGNISRGRGQDLAIRAMPRILRRWPRAVCVIAGEPHPRCVDREYANQLRHLCARLAVNNAVRFVGFVPRIDDLYDTCDLIVNPARVNETFGRIACEALAAGRPVVSTRAGAIPEILRDGQDAVLVDVDDLDGLVEAVSLMLREPDRAATLMMSGRDWVRKRYSEDHSINSFSGAVRTALDLPS